MRIVFGLDGSDCSKAALHAADKMKCPIGTEIKVVTVLDFSEPFPSCDDIRQMECMAAQKLVYDAVKELQDTHSNAEVSGEVLDGYPVEAILQLSRNWLADLVVVGSHGRKGFSRFWLGSVSRALLMHAPCAVRIIRPERSTEGTGSNVLIALDDSEHSRHLIDHVLAMPWGEGSRFRCIHVVRALDRGVLLDENADLIPDLTTNVDEILKKRRDWLDEAAERINGRFEQKVATAEVLTGDAREKLLQIAAEWPADLLMLGSHGRRGIDKFIMGSVSEAVASNAGCSVEVTRVPAFRKRGMHILV